MRAGSDEMWRELLAARIGDRPIGIVSTASEDPAATGGTYADRINRRHGQGAAVYIPLGDAEGQAEAAETVARIEACGGFFFTGGIQSRTTRVLLGPDGGGTPALAAIRALHRRGGVIGGSSAGAAVMSDPMISGGSSAAALRYGATPVVDPEPRHRGVAIAPGLGFHPGVLYCQHHLERGRFGRLVAALASPELDIDTGVGVAEDTAFVVDFSAQTGRVIGSRGVFFIESANATRDARGVIRGLRMHFLDRGDRIHLKTGEIRPAEGKSAVVREEGDAAGRASPAEPVAAWDRDAIFHLLTSLAQQSGDEPALARDEHHNLHFRKTAETRLWSADGDERPPRWTIFNIEVEIAPR